ncbi:MAG: hypothetical protein ABFS19_11180, partial [Thermodesulfobacteriota bacterium]
KKSLETVIEAAEIDNLEISADTLKKRTLKSITSEQLKVLKTLEGRVFTHRWQLDEALAELSPEFQFKKGNAVENDHLHSLLKQLYDNFRL